MINIYIYLDNEADSESLVTNLLNQQLIAHASVDRDNNSFRKLNGLVVKETQYLITAQTRALLFTEVVKVVNSFTQGEAKIYSVPITQCTDSFSDFIRQQTKISA